MRDENKEKEDVIEGRRDVRGEERGGGKESSEGEGDERKEVKIDNVKGEEERG